MSSPADTGVPAGSDPVITTDEALDRHFASGHDDALRRVYDRYGTLVHTFCRRALGASDAADATQETFVAAWRSRARYDVTRGSVGAWLMGIARFTVLAHLRRAGRIPEPVGDGPADARWSEIESIADRLLLTDAMNQLAPRARTVIEMAFFEDLTHAQIAQRSGLPLGTVKSDVRRGLDQLRHHLTRRTELRGGSDE